jgi:hypothetical protein
MVFEMAKEINLIDIKESFEEFERLKKRIQEDFQNHLIVLGFKKENYPNLKIEFDDNLNMLVVDDKRENEFTYCKYNMTIKGKVYIDNKMLECVLRFFQYRNKMQ